MMLERGRVLELCEGRRPSYRPAEQGDELSQSRVVWPSVEGEGAVMAELRGCRSSDGVLEEQAGHQEHTAMLLLKMEQLAAHRSCLRVCTSRDERVSTPAALIDRPLW